MSTRMSRLSSSVHLTAFSTSAICLAFAALTLQSGNALAFGSSLIVMAIGFHLAYFRGRPLDVLSPIVGLSTLLVLYSLTGALFVEAEGRTYYDESLPSGTMPRYYAACFLGLAFLLIGILWARSKSRPQPLNSAAGRRLDSTFVRTLPLVTFVVAASLSPWWMPKMNPTDIASYAEQALEVRIERMANVGSGLTQVFLIQVPIAMLLMWATWTMWVSRSKLLRVLGAALIADYLVVQMMSGWRGEVVYGASIMLCYFHYRVRRFRLREGVAIGLAAYVLINGIALVRSTSDPGQMLKLFTDTLQTQGPEALGLTNSAELAVSVNLVREISGIDSGETSYQWGQGWLNEIAVLVPRFFLPDRPLPMSEQFVEVFYPGVREAGGGYGFFIIQEGYWQFGLPGVCFTMLLYGYLVERIYRRLILLKGGEFHVFAYGFVYSALVLGAPRSGAFLSFKTALINLLGLLIIWMVARVLTRSQDVRAHIRSSQEVVV